MVKNSGVRNLACAFFFFGTLVLNSYGQTYTVTVNYEANFGANPESPLISVFQNNFYGGLFGTTFSGGDWNGCGNQWGCGTISGGGNPLYSFCSNPGCTDGSGPASGLVQTTTGNLYGNLYGATQTGGNNVSSCGQYGCGTIFEYSFSNNTLTTLHAFSYTDGTEPTAGLIQATDGNLYGVTRLGGANGDYGTVFQITPAGQFTTLYNFCPQSNCPDGRTPYGPLVQGTDGNLYGVTGGGGTYGNGTVFRITTKGKLTTLYSFCTQTQCADGSGPLAGLIQGTNGNFYGTTASGGSSNGGTVFKITSGGKLTTLYTFCTLTNCTDGKLPYTGVLQATNGNFYGTTSAGGANGYGSIFEITPAGKFTILYNFCSQSTCQDGATPLAGLYEDTGGTLDGTTSVGGLYGSGTRYALSVGLSPFVISTPGSGIVSAPITIVGPNFYDATSVTFNGMSANFSELSSTVISTTVPSGATTGYISVSTGGVYGTMKSNYAFKVIPQLKQFSPTSGPVGTQVTISGVSLTQTKNVTVGGAKATFTINSDNQVTATVPSTAKTGKIVITTLGGSATSVSSFTVTN